MPTAGLRADYTIRLIQALTPLQSWIDLAISEVTSDLGLTLKQKQDICLQKFALGEMYLFPYPCAIFYCQGYLMLLEVFLDSQLF